MRLAFSIALRFLKSNKGQTALIVLGIAIGVSVQLFIGSLITGLQKSLVDKTIGNASQITVMALKEGDFFEEITKNKLKNVAPEEIINSVFLVQGPGILSKDNESMAIVLRGFDWNEAEGIYKLNDRLTEGSLGNDANEVILGVDLAKKLGLKKGDSVDISTPSGKKESFLLTGTYDLGVKSLNDSWVLTNRLTAENFFETEGKISAIEMQVKDVFSADITALALENALNNPELLVTNWKIENASLLSGLSGQTTSSLMIQVFVLISVVLGIASVLAISVVQKSKQIGILKAMGMHNSGASFVFLFQGFLLGILGGILGVFLGIGLSFSFSTFVTNPDGTSLVPFFIDWQFIFISAGIAVTASTLAALIPAIRVSKLDPMEVIKNG